MIIFILIVLVMLTLEYFFLCKRIETLEEYARQLRATVLLNSTLPTIEKRAERNALEAIVRYFRNRRIRKTNEKIAHWKAQADTWGLFLCAGSHMSYERAYMVEALSKQKRYEARLESMLSKIEKAECL
jgi:hypothetical protein